MWNYIIIISGTIIAYLGLQNGFHEKKEDNIKNQRNNKRNRNSFIFSLLGILILLAGGIYSNIKQSKSQNIANENKKISDSLNTTLVNKQSELNTNQTYLNKLELIQIDTLQNILHESFTTNKLQKKLISAQDQLFTSNKKIERLNEEINKNVIGGDSVPIISLWFQPSFSPSTYELDTNFVYAVFRVKNPDKYPIRSLKINITDFQSGIIAKINLQDIPNLNSDSLKYIMAITDKSGNLNQGFYRINPKTKSMWSDNSFNVGDLSKFELNKFYEGKILIAYGEFKYSISLTWSKGSIFYDISGIIDSKKGKILVTDVWPFLLDSINPFGYIELLPQFVGGDLLKFNNPTKQEGYNK